MRRSPIRSNIRPKINSMPRHRSEAAAYLDIYKLVVEKKRLQQELDSIERRQRQIRDRLSIINTQVQSLEDMAHQRRNETPEQTQSPISSPVPQEEQSGSFKTITLEY
ncbi:MAG: hypothetical protein AAFQ57_07060 [Cyanobacteria bacterium J06626_14]